MQIQLPDELLEGIDLSPAIARIDVAIGLYKREQLSMGRAAQVAGVSRWQFQQELGQRKISINYDAEDLRSDLESLDSLKTER